MIPVESDPKALAPPSGLLERMVTRWLMRAARISAVTDLSAHFRFIDFEGEALKDSAWVPGQKIQVKLDTGLATRTYTPILWDELRGATRILAYAHGIGPGSDWVRAAITGAERQILGPRRSMDLENLPGNTLLFGDETSFGLAAAVRTRPTGLGEIRPVFEVTSLAEAKPVLDRLGIDAVVIERRPNDEHLSAVTRAIEPLIDESMHFILSGKAQSIQFVSRALKDRGIPPRRLRTKAYWAPGKKGLD